MPTRIKVIIAAVLITYCLSSCKRGGYYQDSEIDSELQVELDSLNRYLIKGIATADTKRLVDICSEEISKADLEKGMGEVIDEIQRLAINSPYTIKHRFYANYPNKGQTVTVTNGTDGEHDFAINYTSPTRRSFVTVGYLEDSMQTMAVTTIWASYNGKWKVYSLRTGSIRAYGKDAIDWYYIARQRYADDALADAHNCMVICRKLLQPGGDNWHYRSHDDMMALSEQIKNTADRELQLPKSLSTVASTPNIINVGPSFFVEGYYPIIGYVTSLRFDDTVALSRECDSINAHIGEVFNHLEHYNKTLLYPAYNKLPADSLDEEQYFTMVKNSIAPWHY